jgi:hypothetical protein
MRHLKFRVWVAKTCLFYVFLMVNRFPDLAREVDFFQPPLTVSFNSLS